MLGERLKRARIKAGLSMEKLVQQANNIVTKQAISQYEKGQKTPSSTVLLALAKSLDVSIDYFFRKMSIEIGQVDFRKHSSFGIKQQEMLKEKVRDELERYIELEKILDSNRAFKNPLDNFKIASLEDAESAAKKLREEWKLGFDEISNIMQILELNEIKVIYIEENSLRFNGLCGYTKDFNHPFIVVNSNEKLPLDRKRFTVAHELGHLLLEKNIISNDNHESIANRFAGAFLLPEEIIKNEIGEKRTSIALREVVSLKEKYKISIQAIMYRLKDLNIISEAKYKSFAIANKRQKYDEANRLQCENNEIINRFENLLTRAYNEELISLSKYAELGGISINEAQEKIGVSI
ncbi:MAG: hypothetical protein KN64_01985 [Sulfurovum sp. AS07-7]|nr:MAG: hypothetical protein KN64_01985 [Sulfurovum sp. AS07-7]